MYRLIVRVKTKDQLEAVRNNNVVSAVAVDHSLFGYLLKVYNGNTGFEGLRSLPVFLSLPDVAREMKIDSVETMIRKARENRFGVIVKNLDELSMLKSLDFTGDIIGDSFLYAYNSEAVKFYKNMFPQMEFMASDELTDAELNGLSKTASVDFIYKLYGHQQLMITNQCFRNNYGGCTKPNGYIKKNPELAAAVKKLPYLTYSDERNNDFYITNDCGQCYSTIYLGLATSMIDKISTVEAFTCFADFTVETKAETEEVLECIENAVNYQAATLHHPTCRGHHFKGID